MNDAELDEIEKKLNELCTAIERKARANGQRLDDPDVAPLHSTALRAVGKIYRMRQDRAASAAATKSLLRFLDSGVQQMRGTTLQRRARSARHGLLKMMAGQEQAARAEFEEMGRRHKRPGAAGSGVMIYCFELRRRGHGFIGSTDEFALHLAAGHVRGTVLWEDLVPAARQSIRDFVDGMLTIEPMQDGESQGAGDELAFATTTDVRAFVRAWRRCGIGGQIRFCPVWPIVQQLVR